MKRALPNWDLYPQRSMWFGWVERPYDDICQWTSVTCRDRHVVALQLQTNASFHLGNSLYFALELRIPPRQSGGSPAHVNVSPCFPHAQSAGQSRHVLQFALMAPSCSPVA